MAAPTKEPIDKHFQNGQRRHNENEVESHLKRGSVRTEQTEKEEEDAEECLGAVGGQGLPLPPPSNFNLRRRQQTGSARSPVDSTGQPSGRLMPPLRNGQIGMNELYHLDLPKPAGMNRQFLEALQHIPEHLRLQVIFNHWPHQRTGAASEERQYQIEEKKHLARLILRNKLQMDEKLIDSILISLEPLLH